MRTNNAGDARTIRWSAATGNPMAIDGKLESAYMCDQPVVYHVVVVVCFCGPGPGFVYASCRWLVSAKRTGVCDVTPVRSPIRVILIYAKIKLLGFLERVGGWCQ